MSERRRSWFGLDPERRQPMWRRYLRMVRPDPIGDLDDELRDHLDSTIEALVSEGLPPDAARAEALRRFGDVSRFRREVEKLDRRHATFTNGVHMLETIVYDIRHAARGLRHAPGFTFVAALSIALGVAANATVFSVVNAILLRPIPGAHSPRLVRLYQNHHSPFDWRELSWFRSRGQSFEYVVGERYGAMAFRAKPGADAERIRTSYVTQGFFPALGVRMAAGRFFESREMPGELGDPVVVLSHAFWQRRFAGDSAAIGQTVVLGEHPFRIAGVMDANFRSSVVLWAPDILIPFSSAPVITGQRLQDFGGSFYTTARLRPGVSTQQAQKELDVLMSQLALTDSARYERTTARLDHVRGVNAEMRQVVTAGSAFLMAMVGMVLLIACANVANLLLGRAAARRTEIGIRQAIGASRGRLVRQLITESFLLAALGSALGFVAALLLTRILPAAIPAEAGIDQQYFRPDFRVLAFTGTLCLLTTLLFGALPSLRAASPNLVGLLKGEIGEPGRRRRRGALVSVQTALCVVLLAVASLFLRSLASMHGVDPGFRAEGITDVTIDLGLMGANVDRERTFASIIKSASELPGVESASLTAIVPLSGSNMETRILPQGTVITSRRDAPSTYFNIVSPKYFATMRTPLLAGREFLDSDGPNAPRVAVISQTLARRLWPNTNAIGRRLHWGAADGPLIEVVGVARDANYVMPGEVPKSVVYVPLAQEPRSEMTLQVRSAANAGVLRRPIWDVLRFAAPTLPPPPVASMSDDMAITLLPVRLGAGLLGVFGGLALVLAAAGIYGVASYSVARRSREIGVRAALGATRGRLIKMVLGESARRVAWGAIVGLAITVAAGTALSRVLYGVRSIDPLVLTGVAALMGLVAIVSTLAPAVRAARADPVSAMRTE